MLHIIYYIFTYINYPFININLCNQNYNLIVDNTLNDIYIKNNKCNYTNISSNFKYDGIFGIKNNNFIKNKTLIFDKNNITITNNRLNKYNGINIYKWQLKILNIKYNNIFLNSWIYKKNISNYNAIIDTTYPYISLPNIVINSILKKFNNIKYDQKLKYFYLDKYIDHKSLFLYILNKNNYYNIKIIELDNLLYFYNNKYILKISNISDTIILGQPFLNSYKIYVNNNIINFINNKYKIYRFKFKYFYVTNILLIFLLFLLIIFKKYKKRITYSIL